MGREAGGNTCTTLQRVDEPAFLSPHPLGGRLLRETGAGLDLEDANNVDGIDVSLILGPLFLGKSPFVASVSELIDAGLHLRGSPHGGQFLGELNGHHLPDWLKELAEDIRQIGGGRELAHYCPVYHGLSAAGNG